MQPPLDTTQQNHHDADEAYVGLCEADELTAESVAGRSVHSAEYSRQMRQLAQTLLSPERD